MAVVVLAAEAGESEREVKAPMPPHVGVLVGGFVEVEIMGGILGCRPSAYLVASAD